jgi:hypothetical protein
VLINCGAVRLIADMTATLSCDRSGVGLDLGQADEVGAGDEHHRQFR